MNTNHDSDFAREAISEILDSGLKHSTFADSFPQAYTALLQYRGDLEQSLLNVLSRDNQQVVKR